MAENQLRQPPHDLVAEASVLGAMLLNKMAISDVVEILDAEHFYRPAYGHIYSAISTLYATGEPVDPVTVSSELTAAGLLDAIGGPSVLFTLQSDVPAVGNAAAYARIVEEKALLRRAIDVSNQIAEMAYGVPDDVAKMIDEAEALMYEVGQRRLTGTTVEIKDLLSENLDRLEALYEQSGDITGVPTGFLDLDKHLAGLQKNAMYVVGARPAMGKTAFLLGMATNAAKAGHPVLLFSLEMSALELSQRILCSEARVDSTRIKTGNLQEDDWARIATATGTLAETPIYIDDHPQTSIMEIRAKARRLKSTVGELGLVAVDYIQLMSGRSNAESRQVEVSEISRGLKILARELEAPVVALAQLNRSLEQRVDKRPMLSDLRESGCLVASTRLLRADGTETTLGELVETGETPNVWAVDGRGKVVSRRLTRAFTSGVKPTFRMEMKSGRWIEATGCHRFLTDEGWCHLADLSVGSSIATPRSIPESEKPEVWPEPEVVFLAHLLGDGSVVEAMKYASVDEADIAAVEDAVRDFGCETRRMDDGTAVGGRRPHEKTIPEAVHRLKTPQVALFLHHLWATDGLITIRQGKGPEVSCYYASTSREMADGVQRLLLRFEIRSKISTVTKAGHRDRYHVDIFGKDDQLRFFTEIGCHGERGDAIPAAVEVLTAVKANPNNGLVPWEITGSDAVIEAATSDIHWDQITAIESIGEQAVFDATVEIDHNFIANGIVAHNSLEQDADVVMFLYRDEVYDEQSPDKGVAEVIVAKHRNGPVGKVRLAFRGQYTRFDNMARSIPGTGPPPSDDGAGPGGDPGPDF